MKQIAICAVISVSLVIMSKEEDAIDYLKKGNLALPASQQPNSQLGMGQNIVDKGDFLGYIAPSGIVGKRQDFITLNPILLYGITNNASILASWPLFAEQKVANSRSEGIGDLLVQFEYAYYNKSRYTYADQATVIASIILPTAPTKKVPHLGFGSPAFLLGGTYSHTAVDWYYYASVEGLITTTNENNAKFGNQFFYQWGVGRNLGNPGGSIITAMMEFSGIYTAHDRIGGVRDPNSGGNVIFAGPSLWISTERFIFHPDLAFPIAQRLFGKQNKYYYLVALTLGWKFNG